MVPTKDASLLIHSFHLQCHISAKQYRTKVLERINVSHYIRKMLQEVQKNMYAQIAEIEKERADKEKQIEEAATAV